MMETNEWISPNISTKLWLKPDVTKESVFFAIQHLGLEKMNVVSAEKKQPLPKRKMFGLIAVYPMTVLKQNKRPFMQASKRISLSPSRVAAAHDGEKQPNEVVNAAKEPPVASEKGAVPAKSTQVVLATQVEKHRFLPQTIQNSELSINLVNFTLLASTTYGERCGKFLKKYFDRKMKAAVIAGKDIAGGIIPLAFAHNLTGKEFPHHEEMEEFYFAVDNFRNKVELIDKNGEAIDVSDETVEQFCSSLEDTGACRILAIVDDNSKKLIEQLQRVRKELNDSSKTSDILDDSRFLEVSEDILSFDREEKNDSVLSDLAELTAASENYLEASDYDLLIEDNGEILNSSAFDNSVVSTRFEDEDIKRRYLHLINKVSQAKKDFDHLWFQRMEDYDPLLHPEFDKFYSAYSKVLEAEVGEISDISIKEAALATQQVVVDETEKENTVQEGEKTVAETSTRTRGVKRKEVPQVGGAKKRERVNETLTKKRRN